MKRTGPNPSARARVLKGSVPVEDAYDVPESHREEFLGMRQALCRALPEGAVRTLLFASATRGEGTTTIISQFAVFLAQSGDKVVLVDANLRNPAIHSRFQLDKECGFADLVVRACSARDALKSTKLEGFSIVTSGSSDSNPYCLFDRERMKPAVDELRTMADWVLLDTSAVNEFNDALSIACLVEGVILVIEAEKTPREVARYAIARAEGTDAPIMGSVLNRRKTYIPSWITSRLRQNGRRRTR